MKGTEYLRRTGLMLVLLAFAAGSAVAQDDSREAGYNKETETDSIIDFFEQTRAFMDDNFIELNGFLEVRGGFRLRNDPMQKGLSVMETRFQHDIFTMQEWGDFRYKGDLIGDAVLEDALYDLRELNVALRPLDFMDTKIGRQVLTWGTGDLIFINDMFPKDWQSFFIGRDIEYLKAPSDAAKFSFFTDWVNFDVVYTPKFDSDRFISGERISFYGQQEPETAIDWDRPNDCFGDEEIALRFFRNINNYELALYGYRGYWKSPGGQNLAGEAIFPDLDVYGASVRGELGKGIGHIEMGYYRSIDDEGGDNVMINNSEVRFLFGYSQELAKNLTGGVQYYLEHMVNYGNYENSLPAGMPGRDRNRHLLTFRLTQLLMQQNLELGLFTFYSPSDQDAYLRPNARYKIDDHWTVEGGGNIFFGDYRHTFFGQFTNNTNIYGALRYNF